MMSNHTIWLAVLESWRGDPVGIAAVVLSGAGAAALAAGGARRAGGWVAAAGALAALTLCSPLGTYAHGILFTAHMLQHLILLLAVPLLLVHAWAAYRAEARAAAGIVEPPRGESTRPRMQLVAGKVAMLGGMWVWLVPALSSAALTHWWIGVVQVLSLLGAGCIFWRPLVGPNAFSGPIAVAYLFLTCLGCTALGIYITFASVSLSPVFLHGAQTAVARGLAPTGWSPSVDQQVAGLVMWVLPCVGYVITAMVAMGRWYDENLETFPDEPLAELPQP